MKIYVATNFLPRLAVAGFFFCSTCNRVSLFSPIRTFHDNDNDNDRRMGVTAVADQPDYN